MSMDDIDRIISKLDDLGNRMTKLETRVDAMALQVGELISIKDRTTTAENRIAALQLNCEKVQAGKLVGRIPWQNIIPTVLAGIIMILVGAVLALVLR